MTSLNPHDKIGRFSNVIKVTFDQNGLSSRLKMCQVHPISDQLVVTIPWIILIGRNPGPRLGDFRKSSCNGVRFELGFTSTNRFRTRAAENKGMKLN